MHALVALDTSWRPRHQHNRTGRHALPHCASRVPAPIQSARVGIWPPGRAETLGPPRRTPGGAVIGQAVGRRDQTPPPDNDIRRTSGMRNTS